jgi:hypothetical protein
MRTILLALFATTLLAAPAHATRGTAQRSSKSRKKGEGSLAGRQHWWNSRHGGGGSRTGSHWMGGQRGGGGKLGRKNIRHGKPRS